MIKRIPLQLGEYGVFAPSDLTGDLDALFNALFEESPEFWKYGLNRTLYTGIGDKLFAIKDDNSVVGFIGLQAYRKGDDGELHTVISVGLLHEYRGKGIMYDMLSDTLEGEGADTEYLWPVNEHNAGSLALFNKMVNSGKFPNLKVQIQYDEE